MKIALKSELGENTLETRLIVGDFVASSKTRIGPETRGYGKEEMWST